MTSTGSRRAGADPGALSPERLTPLLRERLDPGARCTEIRRGVVGNGQETWFVTAADGTGAEHRLVLRRTAAGGTLHFTDRALEGAVLRALSGSGMPVPRVFWEEGEPSSLERPYLMMDRMPGSARILAGSAGAVATDLGRVLARLHALRIEVPELGPVPAVAAATRCEVSRWRERYRAERLGPVPLLGALLAWLEAHVPDETGPAVLLWGDPGPHNVLVEGDRISAILDWELAHHGSPVEDVAVAMWSCRGRLDPELLLAGYESVAGPVDRALLDYHTVMACVSRAVMLLAGDAAFVAGRSDSPVLAGLGLDLLADSLLRAADLLGWGAAGSAAGAPGTAPDPPRAGAEPDLLRPDAAETATGVARFLAGSVLPALDDARLIRELKTAVALLDTVALRIRAGADPVPAGGPATGPRPFGVADGAAAALEERAVRAESDQDRTAERGSLRAQLVAGLRAGRAPLAPLTRLYGG